METVSIGAVSEQVNERGTLGIINIEEVPFRVKRIFYIYDVPRNGVRGAHAHKECKQFIVCQKGKILVSVATKGKNFSFTIMDGQTLFVDKMTWLTLSFMREETTVLVLCSHEYDAADYIYNFSELT